MRTLINFFEIPAEDILRAAKFYTEVFDLEIKINDCGKEKMGFFPKEFNIMGAIVQSPEIKPSTYGVLITSQVGKDMNVILNKIVTARGNIVKEKSKISGDNGFCHGFRY